jgi:hypothetical protein
MRWWGGTMLAVILAGAGIQLVLPAQGEKRDLTIARAEVPEGWRALPVTARLTDQAVSSTDGDGCSYNEYTHHSAKLGRFVVTWTSWTYKGVGAGSGAWRLSAPGVSGYYGSPSGDYPGGSGPPRPDTLREDAATGLYVITGYDTLMGAFRVSEVVTAPAHRASARQRLGWGAFAMVTAMVISIVARVAMQRRDDR